MWLWRGSGGKYGGTESKVQPRSPGRSHPRARFRLYSSGTVLLRDDPLVPFRVYTRPRQVLLYFYAASLSAGAPRPSWELLDCPINVARLHVKVCQTVPPLPPET